MPGVLLALTLPGCRLLMPERNTTELTIWSAPTGPEEQGFIRLCHRFEREHPGVTVRNVGATSPDELIRAIVANAAPDLAYLYGPAALGPLAANHGVVPLDSWFDRAGLRDTDFLPAAIAQGRYQGSLYALPVTRDSRAFYWNRTLFREAGLDPDRPPQTLEEAQALAVRLTRYNPDGSLFRLGMGLPEDPAIVFGLFGGNVVDTKTGRITADTPENIAALTWLVGLADAQGGYRRIAGLVSGFGNEASAQNPLTTGKLAMKIDGEWVAMHLEKFAPQTDYKITEVPHPAHHPELSNMAWEDGDILVIPAGSRHPDMAWEFMRWMQLPAQQEGYAVLMNNLPSIMALRNSPRLSEGSRSLRALGYVLQHIASDGRNAHYFPSLPITQLYANALKDAFDRALYHDRTPEQALKEVQARIEQELLHYR